MSLLHTLRTARAMRVAALLGYLLVITASGVTPWTQPIVFGNLCSAAGNDVDHDPGIGCALCLPTGAPAQSQAAVPPARAVADARQSVSIHPLLEAQAAVMPPARAPPTV